MLFRALRLRRRARRILKLKKLLQKDLTYYYDYLLYHAHRPGRVDVIDEDEIVEALK